jgi:hypothetical protein
VSGRVGLDRLPDKRLIVTGITGIAVAARFIGNGRFRGSFFEWLLRLANFSVLAGAAHSHRVKYRSCRAYPEAKQREQARNAGRWISYTVADNQSDGIGDKDRGCCPPRLLYIRKPVLLLAIKILGGHRRLRPDRRGNRQRGRKCGFS